MSELQGPRIPGEERSGRRRPLGWIVGALIALLLLALLIPFACQALGGEPGPQGGGAGAQQERTDVQGAAGAGAGDTAADAGNATGETTRPEAARAGGQQGGETAAKANRATGYEPEKISGEQAATRDREPLPETGGMSPAVLLAVGTALLLVGSTGLSAVVRRRSANRG
jgi:LPXTG-motif cell wall-anchored protein